MCTLVQSTLNLLSCFGLVVSTTPLTRRGTEIKVKIAARQMRLTFHWVYSCYFWGLASSLKNCNSPRTVRGGKLHMKSFHGKKVSYFGRESGWVLMKGYPEVKQTTGISETKKRGLKSCSMTQKCKLVNWDDQLKYWLELFSFEFQTETWTKNISSVRFLCCVDADFNI